MLRWVERAALAALFVLLAWQVLAEPLTGIANSGDFERVMSWGGLSYQTDVYAEKYFGWVVGTFAITWNPLVALGGYLSSEGLFVKLAACLARLAGPTMDLRVLGMVHVAAFVGAVAVLFAGWKAAFARSPLFLVPGFALLLADNAYVAYFNSLYSEPATMVFLLLTLGSGFLLASAVTPEKRHLMGFFASALGLLTAKMQNVTLAVPLLVFVAWLYVQHADASIRRRLLKGCAAFVLVGALQYVANPPSMTQCNEYSAVFNGILVNSATPKEDLRSLGLDAQYAVLAGTNIFMPTLPLDVKSRAFDEGFYQRVNHRKILTFYATHPSRLLEKLNVAADRGFFLRPSYLGSFEHASGRPARSLSDRYSLWSTFKLNQLPHTLPLVVGTALLLATWVLVGLARRGRAGATPFVLLLAMGGMGAIAFVTPVLGDGHSDIEKHMFLFNLLFDLALTFASAHLLALLVPRRRGHEAPTELVAVVPAAEPKVPAGVGS